MSTQPVTTNPVQEMTFEEQLALARDIFDAGDLVNTRVRLAVGLADMEHDYLIASFGWGQPYDFTPRDDWDELPGDDIFLVSDGLRASQHRCDTWADATICALAHLLMPQLIEQHRRLRGWLEAIADLADAEADERGWMVRDALAGLEPPTAIGDNA